MNIKLNGQTIDKKVVIKELDNDFQTKLGLRVAFEETKNNGIDEIFFESNNKKYILASDNLNLSNIKTDKGMPTLTINNHVVKVFRVQNELNSKMETLKVVSKGALKSAVADGVGGAAGGALVGALGLGGVTAGPGALVGFLSGFAWGAGSSIVSDLGKIVGEANWDTIRDITK